MKKHTTILFDIGWPIIDESILEEKLFDFMIRNINEELKITISDEERERVILEGVNCFAPSLFSYFIWHFVRPDEKMYDEIRKRFDLFDINPYCRLQPNLYRLLGSLKGEFKLGFAANQKSKVHHYLEREGISDYFDSKLVSEDIGYVKPDLRHFYTILKDIGSSPEESIMVGDRLDNDIIPANLIGMTTVQFPSGPHKIQKPRYPGEIPDFVIENMIDLLKISPVKQILG